MKTSEIKRISKFLSLILRHQPEKIELELDNHGWAKIDEIIDKAAIHNVHFDMDLLNEVVNTNNKKRFTFNKEKTKIRANQGHSIDIDIELSPMKPIDILYHGTATKNIETILNSGISKMKRQHVHLSAEIDTAKNVGSRHGKPVVLCINAIEMYEDGCHFYLSKNGVWLTDFVDEKYIEIYE